MTSCTQRVLVVDDDPSIGESIKLVLEYVGHTVELAASGVEALAKFDKDSYDVVLTDHVMAGMTGVQLAEEIKSRSAAQPVILFSGSPPFTPTTAIDLVMLKPASTVKIREAVANFAGSSKLEKTRRETPVATPRDSRNTSMGEAGE